MIHSLRFVITFGVILPYVQSAAVRKYRIQFALITGYLKLVILAVGQGRLNEIIGIFEN